MTAVRAQDRTGVDRSRGHRRLGAGGGGENGVIGVIRASEVRSRVDAASLITRAVVIVDGEIERVDERFQGRGDRFVDRSADVNITAVAVTDVAVTEVIGNAFIKPNFGGGKIPSSVDLISVVLFGGFFVLFGGFFAAVGSFLMPIQGLADGESLRAKVATHFRL